MVKVMYNGKLVYKVVIWALFGISSWNEEVALIFVIFIVIEIFKQYYSYTMLISLYAITSLQHVQACLFRQ